jgi:hypothetical protein
MTGIPFQTFLLRHQFTPERAFIRELPFGCLLDQANPTRSSQRGSLVFPLCKREVGPEVGSTMAIGGGGGEEVTEIAMRSRIVVGSDPVRCDVTLPAAPTVAPVHAYFFVRRGRLHLADCGAPHGTYIAGAQLRPNQRVPLRPDAIAEVWFGEEGYLHFDPRSLYQYVQYLLGSRAARPRLEADRRGGDPSGAEVEGGGGSRGDDDGVPPVLVEGAAADDLLALADLDDPEAETPAERDRAAALAPTAPPAPPEEPPTELEAPAPRAPVVDPLPAPPRADSAAIRAEVAAPPAAAGPDPWRSGLLAVRQLGPNLQAISVLLERQAEALTLWDADARPGDLEVARPALDGRRPVVTTVHAQLRRSRFRLTVYQR